MGFIEQLGSISEGPRMMSLLERGVSWFYVRHHATRRRYPRYGNNYLDQILLVQPRIPA